MEKSVLKNVSGEINVPFRAREGTNKPDINSEQPTGATGKILSNLKTEDDKQKDENFLNITYSTERNNKTVLNRQNHSNIIGNLNNGANRIPMVQIHAIEMISQPDLPEKSIEKTRQQDVDRARKHFECDTCPHKMFRTLNQLLIHQRIHTEFEWHSIASNNGDGDLLKSDNIRVRNERRSTGNIGRVLDRKSVDSIRADYFNWLPRTSNPNRRSHFGK